MHLESNAFTIDEINESNRNIKDVLLQSRKAIATFFHRRTEKFERLDRCLAFQFIVG